LNGAALRAFGVAALRAGCTWGGILSGRRLLE